MAQAVLMISSDRTILLKESVAGARMRAYAEAFGELHIVVFSCGGTREVIELSPRCRVYPTGSRARIAYIADAISIGRDIIRLCIERGTKTIITTQDPFEAGLVGLIISKMGTRASLDVQIHTDFLSPFFAQLSWLNRLRVCIARCVLPYATSIRVVSNRVKDSLKNDRRYTRLIDRVSVLPIYAPIMPAPLSTSRLFPRFEKVILMTTRLEPEKDIVTALSAFARAEKSVRNAGLIIAGKGSEEVALTGYARTLGIADRVMYLGWKEPADLALIRASSDLFLSTSLYEGYGLALVEAAASGLPIVSTDAGVAKDLLDAHLLVRPGDVDRLATTLIDALHHPDTYQVSQDRIDALTYPSFETYVVRLAESLGIEHSR